MLLIRSSIEINNLSRNDDDDLSLSLSFQLNSESTTKIHYEEFYLATFFSKCFCFIFSGLFPEMLFDSLEFISFHRLMNWKLSSWINYCYCYWFFVCSISRIDYMQITKFFYCVTNKKSHFIKHSLYKKWWMYNDGIYLIINHHLIIEDHK